MLRKVEKNILRSRKAKRVETKSNFRVEGNVDSVREYISSGFWDEMYYSIYNLDWSKWPGWGRNFSFDPDSFFEFLIDITNILLLSLGLLTGYKGLNNIDSCEEITINEEIDSLDWTKKMMLLLLFCFHFFAPLHCCLISPIPIKWILVFINNDNKQKKMLIILVTKYTALFTYSLFIFKG